MSIPADKTKDAATQNSDTLGYEDKATTNKDKSFADKVNDAVSKMTQNSKGEWELPSDITDEAVKFAATSEKRFRDTQSSFTKERQKSKALEAEVGVLKTKAVGAVQVKLTDEQAEELEELKFNDPEAWRKKMNTYEDKARKDQQDQIEKEVKETTATTLEQEELQSRQEQLDNFLKAHKDFKLDDDVIANDIPPRITKKLEEGKITFQEFLQECYDYSTKGKVIKPGEKSPNLPNLSKVSGGDQPDQNAIKEDAVTSYAKEVY